MEFEKMNHETLFVTTEHHSDGYYPTVKTKMPLERDSIVLNFYYNCPACKTGKDEYVLNETQNAIDPQHYIAEACEEEFGFRAPQLLPTVRFMYTAFYIITMTKHTFHKETGTITSEQPQVIYAGIATKDKGSAFQIMFLHQKILLICSIRFMTAMSAAAVGMSVNLL